MDGKEFINSWVSKLSSDGIKNFPADFISLNNSRIEIKLPGKTLLIGEEFFGRYEIITPDGKSVLYADNYLLAKFILYANRNTSGLVLVPSDKNEIKKSVQAYEKYIDNIIKNIEAEYKRLFPDGKNSNLVVNEIFRQLNLVRVLSK